MTSELIAGICEEIGPTNIGAAYDVEDISWDGADHLTDLDRIAAYLDAALEDGDPAVILAALGDVARARGLTDIAKRTGLSRTSLYTTLSHEGNPEFATIVNLLNALGLRLGVRNAA